MSGLLSHRNARSTAEPAQTRRGETLGYAFVTNALKFVFLKDGERVASQKTLLTRGAFGCGYAAL
jgi:hypothetical protein